MENNFNFNNKDGNLYREDVSKKGIKKLENANAADSERLNGPDGIKIRLEHLKKLFNENKKILDNQFSDAEENGPLVFLDKNESEEYDNLKHEQSDLMKDIEELEKEKKFLEGVDPSLN